MGELLTKLNPNYNICSFQVNFDGKLLPSVEEKIRFLKLYAMYEDIVYKFSKGEKSWKKQEEILKSLRGSC